MSDPGPPERRRGRGYAPLLAVLVLMPAIGVLGSLTFGALTGAVMTVALWMIIARATGMSVRLTRVGLTATIALAALAVAALAVDRTGLAVAVELATATAIAAAVVVVGRALARERTITLSTVAGLLSVYLMIGLFFASAYQGALAVSDAAFVSDLAPLERFELVYFSFVTLTTLGYGDIAPGVDATRALAMTEAVIGQLFLVTVVARAVGMLGQRRPDGERRP